MTDPLLPTRSNRLTDSQMRLLISTLARWDHLTPEDAAPAASAHLGLKITASNIRRARSHNPARGLYSSGAKRPPSPTARLRGAQPLTPPPVPPAASLAHPALFNFLDAIQAQQGLVHRLTRVERTLDALCTALGFTPPAE